MKRSVILVLLLLILFPFSLFAETTAPLNSFDKYMLKVDKKFDKGAANAVMGWSEIVGEPVEKFQKTEGKKRWLHAAGGIGTGAVYGVFDTAFGFFNALTSLVPNVEVPLPQGGIRTEQIAGGDAEALLAERSEQIRKASSPSY